jgi:hypothetical protein
MFKMKFAAFFFFCAVALPVKMGMDGKLNKGSDYLAMAILDLVLCVTPGVLLFIFGRRDINRTASVIKAARAQAEAGGHIDISAISGGLRLKETVVRKILDSARRRGVLPSEPRTV